MSTRSRIGMLQQDGSVRSIYCHFDGYPDGVGATLDAHYKDRAKVEALIELGDLSCLDREVAPADGVSHSYGNSAEGVTVAYRRDRGEDTTTASDADVETFYQRAAKGWEEYVYLFDADGAWKVTPVGGGAGPFLVAADDPEGKKPSRFKLLADVLAADHSDDDEDEDEAEAA